MNSPTQPRFTPRAKKRPSFPRRATRANPSPSSVRTRFAPGLAPPASSKRSTSAARRALPISCSIPTRTRATVRRSVACSRRPRTFIRRSTRKNAVHFFRKLFQTFGAVGAPLFGDAPAVVADFVERLHHFRPIIVAFQKRNIEAFPQALFVRLLTAEFLDVQFLNALAEYANPLL